MIKILLIRTGDTEYECQGRIQGTLDVPLSEDGRRQIEQLVESLRDQTIGAFYVAPCRASQQSAEILTDQLGIKSRKIDSLHNLDHGLWQGMLLEDVKTKQPKVYRQWQEHPETVCPPNGETLGDARERIQQALAKLAKKHKEGTVAILLPEPLASLLHCMLLHEAVGGLWRTDDEKSPPWELIEMPAEVVSP
jgi:broad specificity phosphatase PhoE